MSANCRFSIIVPVYNVEEYLNQCVDSVLSQTYTNFELILVDDGSPDNCPQICDEYARRDSRIRVIHQQNGGLSSARNVGLKNANGDYVIFLDSDDYWNNSFLLEDVNGIATNNVDLVVLKHIVHNEINGEDVEVCSKFSRLDFVDDIYENKIYQLISVQLFDTCAWNKVYRREIITENNLFFEESIIAEDLDWAARILLYSKSVDVLDKAYYVYRKGRAGAITSSLKQKNIIDTRDSIIRCLTYPQLKHENAGFKKAYYNYIAYRYVIWHAENHLVKSGNQKELFKEMKQYKWLLNYDSNKKVRLAKITSRCLGLRLTSMLLGFYLKRKF